jgi:hypothetical protein
MNTGSVAETDSSVKPRHCSRNVMHHLSIPPVLPSIHRPPTVLAIWRPSVHLRARLDVAGAGYAPPDGETIRVVEAEPVGPSFRR